MHNTLAQKIIKLDEMKAQLELMDDAAHICSEDWSDPQWQGHHATREQLTDAICEYEHSLLCNLTA